MKLQTLKQTMPHWWYLQFKHSLDNELAVRRRQLATLLQHFNQFRTWNLIEMKLHKTIPESPWQNLQHIHCNNDANSTRGKVIQCPISKVTARTLQVIGEMRFQTFCNTVFRLARKARSPTVERCVWCLLESDLVLVCLPFCFLYFVGAHNHERQMRWTTTTDDEKERRCWWVASTSDNWQNSSSNDTLKRMKRTK